MIIILELYFKWIKGEEFIFVRDDLDSGLYFELSFMDHCAKYEVCPVIEVSSIILMFQDLFLNNQLMFFLIIGDVLQILKICFR